MAAPSQVLFLALSLSFQLTTGDQCSGVSNIFSEIRENSPHATFVANLTAFGDPVTSGLRLCLSGPEADWFFLEGGAVRLNVASGKRLDREALETPVFVVTLSCSEEAFATVQSRILVQVLNENDNKPMFLEKSIMAQNISEVRLPQAGWQHSRERFRVTVRGVCSLLGSLMTCKLCDLCGASLPSLSCRDVGAVAEKPGIRLSLCSPPCRV
ncbi:protocadherin Fat 1-like isoform X1 [Rhinatrema bivittatum]|uniref:protocadherin Fat 1-like isoform X1 n=1 Tax=Rhinatrema bivittatum TaxID=194408 RepID=UPI00112A7451|nr:protocadherin Fat 1-like isoform X1 [Rhinatrema bivittatum]